MTRISPAFLWSLLASTLCVGAAERTIQQRIEGRSFPSIFQAWNGAEPEPGVPEDTLLARHDLAFFGPTQIGLRWNHSAEGLADGFEPASVTAALARRRSLLAKNSNMVLLAEVRYRDAHRSHLPEDHRWWQRDAAGKPVVGWEEGGYWLLDFSRPEVRVQVAAQARALVATGVFDGVMLDWWDDGPDREALLKAIRSAVGEDALILANANDRRTPVTAPLLNGYFMECWRSKTPEDWARIGDTLRWAEANLRSPRINCTETWFHRSRQDLALMRATTTLVLTQSDGYALFADPNELPTPDHRHDWYAFWNRSLGRPVAKGALQPDGSWHRRFDHGWAVYNPPGNPPVRFESPAPMRAVSDGGVGRSRQVPGGDGEIFVRVDEAP